MRHKRRRHHTLIHHKPPLLPDSSPSIIQLPIFSQIKRRCENENLCIYTMVGVTCISESHTELWISSPEAVGVILQKVKRQFKETLSRQRDLDYL